jgi:8-oxo-dGTP diphosphatase
MGEKVLVCDIDGRGWCIPSGRVEPEESSLEAIRREALEEAGAVLCDVDYIGCYQVNERHEIRWADCYSARVLQLVEVGMPEESKGVRLVTLDELPKIYHVWNELTQLVFEHSRQVVMRKQAS